jgi:LPS sulfotransferase NodH
MTRTPPMRREDPSRKNVLVFGAGRSGTTWLAQILAAAGLELIFEPLNPQMVPECCEWKPLPL